MYACLSLGESFVSLFLSFLDNLLGNLSAPLFCLVTDTLLENCIMRLKKSMVVIPPFFSLPVLSFLKSPKIILVVRYNRVHLVVNVLSERISVILLNVVVKVYHENCDYNELKNFIFLSLSLNNKSRTL